MRQAHAGAVRLARDRNMTILRGFLFVSQPVDDQWAEVFHCSGTACHVAVAEGRCSYGCAPSIQEEIPFLGGSNIVNGRLDGLWWRKEVASPSHYKERGVKAREGGAVGDVSQ